MVSTRKQESNGHIRTILDKSPTRDVVVIGGSAGSLSALKSLFENLEPGMESSIFVVEHFPPKSRDFLPRLLMDYGPLKATSVESGELIQPGHVYAAVPDQHMLVQGDPPQVRLVHGPMQNRFRPAVDPLFRSAAAAFGPRVVAVVLSGALDDGTAGLDAVRRCGGLTVVQDPEEAEVPGMPMSAIRHVEVDHVLPAAAIGSLLGELAREPVDLAHTPPVPRDIWIELSMLEPKVMNGIEVTNSVGHPTMLTCPDCKGALWELSEGGLLRYRCHVGHNYSAEAMMVSQSESLERALWAAVAALQQRQFLCERLLERARDQNWQHTTGDLEEKAAEAATHAQIIRDLLIKGREFSSNQNGSESISAEHEVRGADPSIQ